MGARNLAISLLIFSIFFSIPVFAQNFPCAFDGTVKIDGNLTNGSYITPYINGTSEIPYYEFNETAGFGSYAITIYNSTGEFIKFKIADMWANEVEKKCVSSPVTYTNLTANSLNDSSPCTYNISCSGGYCVCGYCRNDSYYIDDGCCDPGENCQNSPKDCGCPYCGNGACDSGETCDNCPTDCGSCGLGGGGGGGGGCTPNWNCTDWSTCSPEGKQTRTCTDRNNCGTVAGKPVESQDCTYVPPAQPEQAVCGNRICETDLGEDYVNCCSDCGCPTGTECIDNICTAVAPPTAPSGQVPSAGITGMVIGALTNPLIALILMLIIILVLFGISRTRFTVGTRRKRR